MSDFSEREAAWKARNATLAVELVEADWEEQVQRGMAAWYSSPLGEGHDWVGTGSYEPSQEQKDQEVREQVEAILNAALGGGTGDTVCGDYPAPCNCDDPDTHNGH